MVEFWTKQQPVGGYWLGAHRDAGCHCFEERDPETLSSAWKCRDRRLAQHELEVGVREPTVDPNPVVDLQLRRELCEAPDLRVIWLARDLERPRLVTHSSECYKQAVEALRCDDPSDGDDPAWNP
jgi:hypothetical protein